MARLAIPVLAILLSPVLLLVGKPARGQTTATVVKSDESGFKKIAAPFLKTHCVKCHGATRKSGGVRLDDLTTDVTRDRARWLAVRDQIRDGLMPPAKEPRPKATTALEMVGWVSKQTGTPIAPLPNQGNLIAHELLFGKPAPAVVAPAARIWRLSPEGYMGFVQGVTRGKPPAIVQPFNLTPERGIKDFAGLYTIDEPSTEILLRNAEIIVDIQTGHDIKAGKLQGRNNSVREFVTLMDPAGKPTKQQLTTALQTQFRMAIGRQAGDDEIKRFMGLYDRCARLGDRPAAVKTMLQAVLLRTDALFRSELGRGKKNAKGAHTLSPREMANAVSLALGHRREQGLQAAAEKGKLETREQVAAHVRRILDDPKIEKPRLLTFFREYFEYHRAPRVFKDKPRGFSHNPGVLVSDTDRLVLSILEADRDVFCELLTTEKSFVNYNLVMNKKTRKKEPRPADVPKPPSAKELKRGVKPTKGPEFIYGLEAWPVQQPTTLPRGQRIGILMQPSWLVAHSTNFDNDPVRRGRWVRERLLGGTVPDLPIGVAAQVPDEKHRTFRDRLKVTRATSCWKCHQHMDDLGLPFEQFDHFGAFRATEAVVDLKATAANVDKKGKPLGPVLRQEKLDTTGLIAHTGDANLDGKVNDPRELIRRIAKSDRARQVFVRHAFRFFMGRNETLSDARTLQDADKAYIASKGSFKALVIALLTSDSFLHRTPLASATPTTSRESK